jgi:D-alanine-D-alanine ligase
MNRFYLNLIEIFELIQPFVIMGNKRYNILWFSMRIQSVKVLVLVGGRSFESDISRVTSKGVISAIEKLGHTVISYDIDDFSLVNAQHLIDQLKQCDVVFNGLHGQNGEDGIIQGFLELCGVPYTHSGVLSSALCMDKEKSMEVAAYNGIHIPFFWCGPLQEAIHKADFFVNQAKLSYPFFIKPINEGSSVGVQIIGSPSELHHSIQKWNYGPSMIMQQYIKGREIHVGVMNDQILGSVEIMPTHSFYDFDAKYTPGETHYKVPAPLTREQESALFTMSEKIYRVLRCDGMVRIDFMVDGECQNPSKMFYFLEANTQPGFTPTSLIPKIQYYRGVSYEQTVQDILDHALSKKK